MTTAHIPRRSSRAAILVAICLAVGGVVVFGDYGAIAREDLSEGLFMSEPILGLVAAGVLLLSSVVALLAFPERLEVEGQGLVSVRGVFGTIRRVRPRETIESVTIHCHQVTSNGFNAIVNDVYIDGSAGRKRLCRFPAKGDPRAEELVAHCAESWDAEVVPWSPRSRS